MKHLFFRLYLLLTFTLVGLAWSIDKLYLSLDKPVDVTSDVALHQGTFMLLNAELLRQPVAQRRDHLTALSTSFGYPIQVIDSANLNTFVQENELVITEAQSEYLASGGIVAVFNDEQGQSWFIKQTSDSSSVMVLGPIYIEPAAKTDYLYIGLLFIGLGIFVFMWVWPISRGLMSLTKAANLFGSGNFTVRAASNMSSPLAELAQQFNAMADRIQGLIKSHQELSHAVSHELRTPIARIRFAMEIIRDEHDIDLKNEYLDTMDVSIEELDGLVDELLIWARFDREQPILNKQRQAVEPFINDIMHKYELTEPNYHFTLESNNESLEVSFDKNAMNKVIDNLIRNAVKYAANKVVVSLKQTGGDIKISVEDDGKGIPEENWSSIFEPFVRLDKSRDRKSGGIGLGLAIVKRFVDLHQGSINLGNSNLGGAKFIVSLPRKAT